MPGASVAWDIVQEFGGALTATSANLPGAAPAVDACEVATVFSAALRDGRLFLAEGRAPGGAVSTLVEVASGGCRVLREGAIPSRELLPTPKT
jgi:L-threonylcarbamoyladenylate synthase